MIGKDNFWQYTYSKKKHFDLFGDLDLELYKEKVNPLDCALKAYQDLLVLAFIKDNVPEGSRILEIGGGDSRIIRHLKRNYEFWNLDKLEGLGCGPTKINVAGFKLVNDYIGNFSSELKNDYFDFSFSISVLEHIPQGEKVLFKSILSDINRVLKLGGLSLHCFDVILRGKRVWANPLLNYIFENQNLINPSISFDKVMADPDVFFISESAFHRIWEPIAKRPYNEYGRPFSYNVLWQKNSC